MSGITPEFEAGKPISAAALERVRMRANLLGDFPRGVPAGGAELGDISPLTALFVTVVTRSVEGPARLSEHAYTVTSGAERWDVDHTRIMVDVEPMLIDGIGAPEGKPMAFWPASVAGSGDASWRSWGILYRGPGAAVNTSDYSVELFGLCVARGC